MTVRLLAVSGLHLDRAWPDENVGVSRGLRDASAGLLLELVQRTLDLGVDALAILGGLWDPATVRSSTVDEVSATLHAIPVPVIVVPDAVEAESGFRPHTLASWPANVHWVAGDGATAVDTEAGLLVTHGPRRFGTAPEEQALALLTTMPTASATSYPVIRSAPRDAERFGGGPEDDHVHRDVEVPVLVPGSGGGRPTGLLVEVEHGSAPRIEPVHFSPSLGETHRLDLGRHDDTASLIGALDDTMASCGPLDRVVVSGQVGPRVLVPPALSWASPRSDVTIRWQDLEHVFPEAPSDRTVQAELIRRLSGPGPDLARRHQALALGLISLDSEEAAV